MKTINIKIKTELSAESFGERIPDRLVTITHRKEIDDLKRRIARLFNLADEIEVSFINYLTILGRINMEIQIDLTYNYQQRSLTIKYSRRHNFKASLQEAFKWKN